MSAFGIPTKYADVKFRSRIEARWASMFDFLGWEWSYEPIDLDGYIPDFMLWFNRPLLVEIKSAVSLSDYWSATTKIDLSGWEHEAIVLGAEAVAPPFHPGIVETVGLIRDESFGGWQELGMGMCSANDHSTNRLDETFGLLRQVGLFSNNGSYHCRVCGGGDGDHHVRYLTAKNITKMWRASCNAVQWKAPA
jgi:hypothetical protein